MPIYKPLHRHGTQAHLSKWAQKKVTLVYARELPSSQESRPRLFKLWHDRYFSATETDTISGKRDGGEGSSRFREKQVIGKYCPCFTISHALCSVIRVPISRSLSTLWIVDAVPQRNKIQRLAATAKHPSVENVTLFPWKS